MHNLRVIHGDLKGVCVPSNQIFTRLSLIYEGEHPCQREPAGVHRRLRSYNYNRCHDSCYCWDFQGIIDLKRDTDVVH